MECWSITGRFNGEPAEKKSKNDTLYYQIIVVYQNESGFVKSIPAFFFDNKSDFSQYKKLKRFLERKKTLNGYLCCINGESHFELNTKIGLVCLGINVLRCDIYVLDDYSVNHAGFTNEILNNVIEEGKDDGRSENN